MVILTHWGRVTHICVSKLTIIGSDNGLSPGRRQAIIWTNDRILLIGPLGTNLSEILIVIYTFSLKKIHLKMSSGKWRPFCVGLNVLNRHEDVEWYVNMHRNWNRLWTSGYRPLFPRTHICQFATNTYRPGIGTKSHLVLRLTEVELD